MNEDCFFHVNTEVLKLQSHAYANTIRFYNKDGVEVGCFDFSRSPVDFTGDATESAKIFVDFVKHHFGIKP